MPKAVSLFSGCGGSDAGLHKAGFEVIFANDVLSYARDFYKQNLPETDYFLGDVRNISAYPNADLLVGCYPCQGFSQGGVRDANRSINFLYREFDRALRKIKPKAFVVENVSGMQRTDLKHLLRAQLTRFRLAGYSVKWDILKAEEYGVPQERRRLFIVGIRSDIGMKYEFPEPTHGVSGTPLISIKDSIGHLPAWPNGEYNNEEFHWYYLSRNRYRDWHQISKTIVAKGRHIGLHPISPKLKKIDTDKWVFEEDTPARRFSYRECALLQGFDKDVSFPDTASMTERYKVIGNAVPPPLFESVVKAFPNIW